ncbi:MAG TPA: ferrous iron transport protein A [Natronincola sp.]|nr:ferrous iron transport protein A [Natronincola sp.]
MTLADLTVGKSGIVEKINAEGILLRRMLDLGLIPGTKVRACYENPTGNPIAYEIRGTIMALRVETAQMVNILREVI